VLHFFQKNIIEGMGSVLNQHKLQLIRQYEGSWIIEQ